MIGEFLFRIIVGAAILALTTWGLMVLAPVLGVANLSFGQSSGIVILAWLVYSMFTGYTEGFSD